MAVYLAKGTPIKSKRALADTLLSVPHRYQEQPNWCWAACSEMLYLFFGITNIRQCDIASAEFGANCCASPGSSVCNRPNWPDNPLYRVGISFTVFNAAFSLFSVRSEIDASQPLLVYYAWSGGGAHIAPLRGYYDNGDLEINDPAYGPGRRAYNYVLNGYGMGSWSMTYYAIRR
jgi:Papain-like cysteine protease AvrRpt2